MASVPSAYRPDMATQQSPCKTPSRRALGDLTPRAINSPASQTKNVMSSEPIRARSPLKKVTSHIPNTFADKENLLDSSIVAPQGKKRGIDEVDGAEMVENAKMLAHQRGADAWSEVRLTTEAIQRHTQNNPVGLVDPGSPTERNTPTPEPEQPQLSQKSNQSFSDFLNYDLCASQKSDPAAPSEHAPATVTIAPAPLSQEKKSRAELLRTRLKFGLYKVKTNQASKRGQDIISTYEASASRSSEVLDASSSTGMTSYTESVDHHRVPNITISSPRREPVFVKANLDPFRPIGKLGAPPVQFAAPREGTQISSRTIYGEASSPSDATAPQSISPTQLGSPSKLSSSYASPMQGLRLGEDDDTDIEAGANAARERLQALAQRSLHGGADASSGAAAKGLLELMSGKR